jgi:hypothetical protein
LARNVCDKLLVISVELSAGIQPDDDESMDQFFGAEGNCSEISTWLSETLPVDVFENSMGYVVFAQILRIQGQWSVAVDYDFKSDRTYKQDKIFGGF